MKTTPTSPFAPERMAEMQDAADKAAKGVRELDAARKACEDMGFLREEIGKRHGLLDIGTPAIRELRDV
jgi:hypothetical protein